MQKQLRQFVISTLGITILGLSISLISWKYKLVTSGLPGYALLVSYFTNVSVGTILIIMNTCILILALIIAGKSSGIKGTFGYLYLSVVIDLSKKILSMTQVAISSIPMNVILYIVQGLIAACAIGFVLHNGYSFGSYSSMLPIADKFIKISPAKFMFILDSILVVITGYFLGFDKGVYLLINAFAFFLSLNFTTQFLNRKLR